MRAKRDRLERWAFIRTGPARFSLNDLHFLQSLANVLAAAVARRRDEDELRRLSLVASKTANGVLILDAEGRAEWTNDAFTQITGYLLDEMREPDSLSRLRCDAPETLRGNWKRRLYSRQARGASVSAQRRRANLA